MAPSRELALQIYEQAQALLTVCNDKSSEEVNDPAESKDKDGKARLTARGTQGNYGTHDGLYVSSASLLSSPRPPPRPPQTPPTPPPTPPRAAQVELLVGGGSGGGSGGLFARLAALSGQPPAVLICTPAPLLQLLTDADFGAPEDRSRASVFWDRQVGFVSN